MAKAFSVLSWNVKHFGAPTSSKNKTPKKSIGPIIDLISEQKADIISIYEVKSSVIFRSVVEKMPNYTFHITEGPQTQEILIGIKNKFDAFVTQKTDFKSGQAGLRPGVLVTLLIDEKFYPLLFLHLKSFPDPKGFGIRDDMILRALSFKKSLDKAAGGASNFIFLGDLNTMGFDYIGKEKDISGEEEIKELERRAKRKKMRVLAKNKPATWKSETSNKYKPSNLDHVVAADHLEFTQFSGADVDVRGWPKLTTEAEKKSWIKKFSDHGLLFFEVQKV